MVYSCLSEAFPSQLVSVHPQSGLVPKLAETLNSWSSDPALGRELVSEAHPSVWKHTNNNVFTWVTGTLVNENRTKTSGFSGGLALTRTHILLHV